MLPLRHIIVVSLEQAVAAPFATRQLADLGARVIKIERPGVGDFARGYDKTVRGLSSHFVWLNRSKQSLTLDLKRPEARDVLDRLIARADVFVQNLAPGAAARLGLEAATLRARDPRLIVGDLSGYGSSGPYRDRKAYDLLIQSEAGLVSITGTAETPSKVGISIADIAAGMYLYSGMLGALFARERTGEGAALEVSLFEALSEWMSYATYYASYGGTPPPRTGASHATIAPYGPFTAGDGRTIYLGIQNEREWARFCAEVLEDAALAADPRFCSNSERVAHRADLDARIAAVFGSRPAAEMLSRLESSGIAYARMNSIAELAEHPQLAARDRWRTIDSPVGPLRALRPPVTVAGMEPVMGAVPAVGEHTDAILAELGIAKDTIAGWRAAGIV